MNHPATDEQSGELSFDSFYRKKYAGLLVFGLLFLRKYTGGARGADMADAEDVVSDAFALLLTKWDSFSPHTEGALTAWMQKTVKNKVYNFCKKRAAAPPTVELQEYLAKQEDLSQAEWAEWELPRDPEQEDLLYARYLAAVRERLGSKQKRLFDCLIAERKSVAETARLLSMKENTVLVGLYRMRKKIRLKILPEILRDGWDGGR